jgi:hypothetical protein
LRFPGESDAEAPQPAIEGIIMTIETPPGFSPEIAAGAPAETTILVTNVPTPVNIVVLPGEGTLWVAYEFGGGEGPAKRVYLWHQGGESITIEPGIGKEYESRPGDLLIYELASPEQSIKLGWGYV